MLDLGMAQNPLLASLILSPAMGNTESFDNFQHPSSVPSTPMILHDPSIPQYQMTLNQPPLLTHPALQRIQNTALPTSSPHIHSPIMSPPTHWYTPNLNFTGTPANLYSPYIPQEFDLTMASSLSNVPGTHYQPRPSFPLLPNPGYAPQQNLNMEFPPMPLDMGMFAGVR
ncbi:hypothetical protein BC829DRAFT_130041 [Chytridium lagenaria]|nr:hypothetical protein BC829DRAFT_130041 [Chytridium lagenaria]